MTTDPLDRISELAARVPDPSPRVLEALCLEVRADPQPKRSHTALFRLSLSMAALVFVFCALTFRALPFEPKGMAYTALSFGIGWGGLVLLGALPHGRLWDRSGRTLLLWTAAGVSLAWLAMQATHFSGHFASIEAAATARCALHAFIKGTLCALALLFVWRRTDPFSPGLSGALLGLVGGLGGTLSVGLLCPNEEGFHLTLGHGLAALAVCGIGFFIGRKWLTP